MDTFTFGVTMTVVCMVSTVVSLWFLSLIINLLKRLFPYSKSEEKTKEDES